MNSWRTILVVSTIFRCGFCCVHRLAALCHDAAGPISAEAADADDRRVPAKVHARHQRATKSSERNFPFIDISQPSWNPTTEEVDRLVREMDAINLRVMVNLSGGTENS